MKQIKMEIGFKLFEFELEEMINYVRSHDSHLVLTTTPVNLEIKPKENL